MNNVHIENDKYLAPFLLAASFSNKVKFVKSTIKNNIVYWYFSPATEAQELIYQFKTKTEAQIPAKDIFDAIDTFWSEITKNKNKYGIYQR